MDRLVVVQGLIGPNDIPKQLKKLKIGVGELINGDEKGLLK